MALERATVSASTGAMNSVLYKIPILLSEEMRMTGSTRRSVLFLMDELKSMKGLLEMLAEAEEHDAVAKGWMSHVREMTYDLDDSIDGFMHSVKKSTTFMLTRMSRMLRAHHQLAKQIQELNRRVIEASERRTRYALREITSSDLQNVSVDPRLRASYVVNKDSPVGIDRQRDELMELLGNDRQQLQVVAIVGFGGVGKTTLAMSIYERCQMQFDCQAVVSASQRFDKNRLLREMLVQVGGAQESGSMERFDLHQLIDALRRSFRAKRYFIVIDDLWSKEAWSIIRYAFPENNLGSIILVTTRMQGVAISCCNRESGYIYKMGPLSDSDSRQLFLRRTFISESRASCPTELHGIINELLRLCGGVPLAIITVASLLASRSADVLEWQRISDSIRSNIHKNESLGGMMSILNLCYAHLPIYLKTCLLYLSMFPEDHVIDRKRLVRRWMAEGFISAEHGESLDKVGDYYFSELITRGLLQPLGIQYDDRVYGCQLHDLISDLIVHRSLEDNFVIRSNRGLAFGLQDKVRRLFFDSRDGWNTFTPSEITTSHVRSLTIFGSNRQMPSLADFHALRVLDLDNCGELESKYFEGIGRLCLLKYLRLQTPSDIQLPEEMGKLENLETLDLTGAPKCKLPKTIIKLNKLVYFLVNNIMLPDRFGRMSSLKEVSCVKINNSNFKSYLQELEKLTMLTALGLNWCIRDEDNDMKDDLASFMSKVITSTIQSLYIESADGCSLDFLLNIHSNSCYHLREFQINSYYFFQTVPKWISTLLNLTRLRINIEVLGEEVLHILAGLESLEALILMVKSIAPEQGFIINSNGFKCIKQFDLTCWNSLGGLKFEPSAMKNLQKLRLVFSTQIEGVDNDFLFIIEHLTSLNHLVVELKCDDVKAKEVKTAVDTINHAVRNHPNGPRLELKRLAVEKAVVGGEREIAVHGEEGEDQNVGHELVVEAESTPAVES